MRYDMAKVVTERPRRGHGNKSAKTGRRLCKDDYDADDHGSVRHPVSRRRQYGWEHKQFSDLIGPLKGYLRKQVGRRWDDVYSELSRHLDKRSTSGSHIWDHVFMEVERYVYLGRDGYWWVHGRYGTYYRVSGLFVNPNTGRLAAQGMHVAGWRWRYYGPPRPKTPQTIFKIDDTRELERKPNGAWMLHTYRNLDPDEVIDFKMIGDREVPVRRRDVKGAILRERVSFRQIGRRDKDLWRRAQDLWARAHETKNAA